MNSEQPPKLLREPDTINFNTIYQAGTDGFVTAHCNSSAAGEIYLEMNTTTPPSNQYCKNYSPANQYRAICVPVPKGYYFRIISSVAVSVDIAKWIPLS